MRADKHDFRAHHHTDTHAITVFYSVSANQSAKTATDNFSKYSCRNECKAKSHKSGVKVVKIKVYPYVCKKCGRENHIIADFDTAVDVRPVGNARKHKSRNVSPRNVSNSKEFFRGVSEHETHHDAKNRDTSCVRIS